MQTPVSDATLTGSPNIAPSMLKGQHIVTIVVPYGIAVAICYLFGYWSRFGINALEYVGIGDVFKLSVFPMLITWASILLGGLLGALLGGIHVRWLDSILHGLFRPRTAVWPAFVGIGLALGTFLFGPEPFRWLLSALFMTYAAVAARQSFLIQRLLGNGPIAFSVLYFGTFLLMIAIYVGREEARRITKGLGESVVDVARSQFGLRGNTKAPVMFLGTLGNARFFYETCTGRTVIVEPFGTLVMQARMTRPFDEPWGVLATVLNPLEGQCTAEAKVATKPIAKKPTPR